MGVPSLALLGYVLVGRIGAQVLDYVHPDDLGYALGMLTEAVRRPGEHSLPVFRVRHGDGRLVEVEASVANVTDGDGFDGLLLVLRPIANRECSPAAGAVSSACCKRSRLAAPVRSAKTSRSVTDWALARLGEFHGAASVVLARSGGRHGEMRIDHEWLVPGAVSALGHLPRALGLRPAVGPPEPPELASSIISDVDVVRLGMSAPARHAARARACVPPSTSRSSTPRSPSAGEHPVGGSRRSARMGTTATRLSCAPSVTSCA